MAEGLNQVTLLGNLGADPELRATAGGQSVLKLRLATTEGYLDKNRVRQERTEWHSVVVWGKRADALAKFLTKGARICVVGSLRTSSYEAEGQKRYRTEVVAREVILNGKGGGSDTGGTETPNRTGSAGGSGHSGGYDDSDYGGGDDDIPF